MGTRVLVSFAAALAVSVLFGAGVGVCRAGEPEEIRFGSEPAVPWVLKALESPSAIPEVTPEPPAVLDLGPEGRVLSAAFAPDGRLYVRALVDVFDWLRWVWFWPEVAAVVSAAALQASLRRRWNRRQAVGQEYCRRCNYLLTGNVSDKCPECGSGLSGRGRMKGRSRRWGLAWRVALLVPCVLVLRYGKRHLPEGWRNAVSARIHWRVTDVDGGVRRWLESCDISADRWFQSVERLLEVDPSTGDIARTLREAPWNPSSDSRAMITTPDGRWIIHQTAPATLTAFDSADGRPVMRWKFDSSRGERVEHVWVSPDGRRILGGGGQLRGEAWWLETGRWVHPKDAVSGPVEAPAPTNIFPVIECDGREWATPSDHFNRCWGTPVITPDWKRIFAARVDFSLNDKVWTLQVCGASNSAAPEPFLFEALRFASRSSVDGYVSLTGSSDGRYVAVGHGGRLRIYDMTRAKPQR
jgi:WD40 repeat protein